jgi:hypothetical protein
MEARKLIWGLNVTVNTINVSFNRAHSGAFIGLFIGHNTLRTQFLLTGAEQQFVCKWCGAEKEKSSQVLFEYEALASPRHTHLCFIPLDPENVKYSTSGALWKFRKWTSLVWIVIKLYCTNFASNVLFASAPNGLETTCYLHLYLHLQIVVYILWHHKFQKIVG